MTAAFAAQHEEVEDERARYDLGMEEFGIRRCPYCHDGITPGQDVVACRDCLAAHHEACWDEAEECSACMCAVALRTGRPPARTATDPNAVNGLQTLAFASWLPLVYALVSVHNDLSGGLGQLIEEPLTGNYVFWLPAFFAAFTFVPTTLTVGALAGAEAILPVFRSGMFRMGLRVAGPLSWGLALLGCVYGIWQGVKAESAQVALDGLVLGSGQWFLLGAVAGLLNYWLSPSEVVAPAEQAEPMTDPPPPEPPPRRPSRVREQDQREKAD